MLFSFIEVTIGIFHTTQCTHIPIGASGSSTIRTRLFAFFGTPKISSWGLISCPRHVYLAGISELCLNAGLVRVSIPLPCYLGFIYLMDKYLKQGFLYHDICPSPSA